MADNGALKKPPGFAPAPPLKPPPQVAAFMGPRKPMGPPPNYRPHKKRRSFCCRCCCCFLCVFLVLLVLIVAFIGVFYALYQPKIPVFRFRPIEFDRFNITANPDGTAAALDSKITIRVEVKNPNGKISIYYGETKVTLTADQETQLGTAIYPAFSQPANNMTLLRFTAVQKTGLDPTTGKKLKERVKSEEMEVNAAVKTKVGVGVFNTKLGMFPVNLNCGGVTLKELNGGKTSPKCSITTLWGWLRIANK